MQSLRTLMANLWPGRPTFTEQNYQDLTGKVYIVTGSTTGLGLEAAKLLAAQNAKVYLHGRSQERLDSATKAVKEAVPSAHIGGLIFDLADLPTIKPGIQPFLEAEPELHGVLLNAGVMMPPTGSVTKQGYELQLGTNNIGHHLVQRLLNDKILATAKHEPEGACRIVWVASDGHTMSPPSGVDWDTVSGAPDVEGKSPSTLYGQSKAINIFQSYQWSTHHADSNVLSVTLHPGVLASDLARSFNRIANFFARYLLYPPKYGAYTELYALLYDSEAFKVFGDDPIYITPFGAAKTGMVRTDVSNAAIDQVGQTVWKYLDCETDKYI